MKTTFRQLIMCSFFFSMLLFYSCESIKNPTLISIENVIIDELSTSTVSMNVDAILNNENSFALDLASAELQILVDDIEVAKIFQTFDTSMPGRSEFPMPLYIKMDLKQLAKDNPIAAVTQGLKIMSERQLNVQLLGTIRVGKGSAKIEVPIDQVQLVSF